MLPRFTAFQNKSMSDLDFRFVLGEHGSSSCFIFIKDETHRLFLTHVFGNPWGEILYYLVQMLRFNEKELEFTWYDEPGFYHWRLLHTDNKLDITILCGQGHDFHKRTKIHEEIIFSTTLKELCLLVFVQMQKMEILLRDSEYAKNRAAEFPREAYNEFRREIKHRFLIP